MTNGIPRQRRGLRSTRYLQVLLSAVLLPAIPLQAGFRYSLKHVGNQCRAFPFPYWSLMEGGASAGRLSSVSQSLNKLGRMATILLCMFGLPQMPLRGQLPEDFRINLKHANGMCREFTFPSWTPPEGRVASLNMFLEFYSDPGLNGDLLVRMRAAVVPYRTPKPEQYFLETYLIDPQSPRNTALTDFRSWDKARSLTYMDLPTWMAEESRRSENDKNADPDAFTWKGRRSPIRGREWTGQPTDRILVSPDSSYVALQSVTAKWSRASQYRSGGFYGGKFFIQIYDLTSGEEVLWVEGRWKKWASATFTSNTEWIQDDLLVMAFDNFLKEKVFLCKIEK